MQQVVPPAMAPPTVSAELRAEPAEPAAAGSLRWTVHPAADEPIRAATLVAVLAVASTLAFEYSGSALLGMLGFLMMALSLRSWFLPRHYALDPTGARESGPLALTRQLPWSDVRSVAPGRFGIYLSTLHTRSRFVRDRGLFLRTAGGKTVRPEPAGSRENGEGATRAPLDRAAVLRFVEGVTQPS